MSPALAEKLTINHGLLAKVEASYGAGGVLASPADLILTEEPPIAPLTYVHDGERGEQSGRGGYALKAKPGGRYIESLPVPVIWRGLGSAYSATVFPLDIHALLRACGHSAAVVTTPGAEKWTYTPISVGGAQASAVFEAYARGQKWAVTGAMGTFGFTIDGPSFLNGTFNFQGISALPVDATEPDPTGASTLIPPKAENVALKLKVGATEYTAARVRGIRFNQNRALLARTDINTEGYGGVAPGRRTPQLEIDIEASALVTSSPYISSTSLSPYHLYHEAQIVEISFQVGSVQYNRFKFSFPYCQLMSPVTEGDDDPLAFWTLQFRCSQSAPGANDDYSVVAD